MGCGRNEGDELRVERSGGTLKSGIFEGKAPHIKASLEPRSGGSWL